jgi:hypothetical protein
MNQPPIAFTILISLLCVVILTIRKDRMIAPFIIAMCFLPADLSYKLGTLDFRAIRVLAVVGAFRVLIVSNEASLKFNKIDKLFIAYNIVGAVIYIVASQSHMGAFVYKGGVCIDTIILYIVFRNLLQSIDVIESIGKIFAMCVLFLLPFIFSEYFSAHNLFSIVGREAISIRNGEVRATGTFNHAILFGSFAVALIPVIWSSYKIERKNFYLFAVLSCLFFVFACSSSGPLVALAGVFFFLSFFKWKRYSPLLAKLILFLAIFIHVVRERELWHFLYVRIAVKASSTGYHRFLLVDAAVKEFKNWWLFGYGDLGPQWHTKYWPRNHAHFTDITNHYLLEGVRGGFFTMVLFILLCFFCIKTLGGLAVRQDSVEYQRLWWGFTVMMIAHCISFLSVAYFGQITMLLYLTIAIAAYAYDVTWQSAGQSITNER